MLGATRNLEERIVLLIVSLQSLNFCNSVIWPFGEWSLKPSWPPPILRAIRTNKNWSFGKVGLLRFYQKLLGTNFSYTFCFLAVVYQCGKKRVSTNPILRNCSLSICFIWLMHSAIESVHLENLKIKLKKKSIYHPTDYITTIFELSLHWMRYTTSGTAY